jgi:hypothetical protein
MPDDEDGPETDGCELDFTEEPDDDETASLRPLFPDGNPNTEQAWRDLFPDQPGDVTSADNAS